MASNVYEDPDLMMNKRYSKRPERGDRLERVVDIYEDSDTCMRHPVNLSKQGREPHTHHHPPAVQRNPFRVLAVILGLLCLLLVVGFAYLYTLYTTSVWNVEQLNNTDTENKQLRSDLDRTGCQFGEENQTQGNTTEWKRFQCKCYYISSERKDWTESREDCKRRGADLVMINTRAKHEFYEKLNEVGEFWIGLRSIKIQDWLEKWEWKWVDGSTLNYTAWKTGVDPENMNDSKVFMDLQGNWNHTSSGSKQWICERDIN